MIFAHSRYNHFYMDESKTSSVKELKKELERIDERTKEKCAPCRIVFGLSVVIFLSVSLYAFVEFSKKEIALRSESNVPFHSLPPSMNDFASTSLEFNQRMSDLSQTAFGGETEKDGSSLRTSSIGDVKISSTSSTVTSPRKVPDGPPPVLLPESH